MKAFFALCRVSFQGLLLNSSQHSKAGKKAASGFGMLFLLSLLCLYLSSVYSFLLASQFAKAGILDLLYVLMCTGAAAASFLFCLFNAAGFVFGGKDTDFLLSLPVPDFALVLSRVIALYLENLFFSVCFLIPAMVAVVINGGRFTLASGLCTLLVCLLLPLLSSAAALLFAYFVSLFENHGRHRILIRTILNFVLFGFIMVFALQANVALASMMIDPASMREGLSRYLWLFCRAAEAMYAGSLGSLALFAVCCAGPFFLIVLVLSRSYRPLLARLSARTARSDYQLGGQRSQGVFSALYKRDMFRYVSSTTYLMNTSVGMLIMVGCCVALLVKKADIAAVIPLLGGSLLPLAAISVGFMISLTCVTAPSISLEGNRLWILKAAPIDPRTIFDVKLALQLTICVPALVISGVLLLFTGLFTFSEVLLLVLLGCTCAFCIGEIGLLCNLKLPKLDGANDTIIVKQSASVLAAMLFGALMCAAGWGLFRLFGLLVSPGGALWLILVLLIVLGAAARRILFTKGVQLFRALI